MNSRLILVPTPIGNLDDITLRALKVLQSVDVVLAEDTRTTGFLLKHHNIQAKLQSFHLHNEHKIATKYAQEIAAGKCYALCTDAGTPGISDPGYLLVQACLALHIPIECLPGATALIPAIVCSGFSCEKFVYEGFLPLKKGRSTRLKILSQESRTMVLYESPHRIKKLIEEIELYFGENRKVCVARELSKKFEEYIRGTASELLHQLNEKEWKGEIVVVIEGNKSTNKNKDED